MTASSTTSIVRDTAAFFTEGTAYQFQHVLSLYPQVLKLKAELKNKKPEELIKLDYWYQNELPKQIKSRGKDAHCNHEELVQLMKWKQARGKFYPQLNYLIKVNTPRAVMNETKKAFKKLPNLEQAITALSNLKGVGTTMASALLAAAAPEIAPFMADECLLAIPEIEGIDYTTKEYLNFVSHIQNTSERLSKEDANGTWNPHSVELALWTHFVACELKPELLDNIPTSNGSSAAADSNDALHQNGDANKSPQSTSKDDECSDEANATVVSTVSKNGESKTEADVNATEDVVNSDNISATNGTATTNDATDVTTTAAPVPHINDATNTAADVIDTAADVVVDVDGDSGKVSPAQIPSNGDVATDYTTTSSTEPQNEMKNDCTINVDSTTNDHNINDEKVRSAEKNIKKTVTADDAKVSPADDAKVSPAEKRDEQKQRPHNNEISTKRLMKLTEEEEEYFSAEEVPEPANKKVKLQPDKELVVDAEQTTSEQMEEPTTSV